MGRTKLQDTGPKTSVSLKLPPGQFSELIRLQAYLTEKRIAEGGPARRQSYSKVVSWLVEEKAAELELACGENGH